jgi:hypothetical protein
MLALAGMDGRVVILRTGRVVNDLKDVFAVELGAAVLSVAWVESTTGVLFRGVQALLVATVDGKVQKVAL